MLIALGERSQEIFNADISSFLDGHLLILSKFWWVSWKKSCSFWDKISQTLWNIFHALEKFSKLWPNFLMLCGKSSHTIIKFHNAFGEKLSNFHQISLMVWGKAPKLHGISLMFWAKTSIFFKSIFLTHWKRVSNLH